MFKRLYELLSGRTEARLQGQIADLERRRLLLEDYVNEQSQWRESQDRVLHRFVQGLATETRSTRDLHGKMIDRLVRQTSSEFKTPTPLPPPHPDAARWGDKTDVWKP